MLSRDQQDTAIRMICDGIVEAVKAAGKLGAPGGVLYAAFIGAGLTLNQFETIMRVLVKTGRLERKGHLYFAKNTGETK